MKASPFIRDKIKEFEGLRLVGFQDGFLCSIGYGHQLFGSNPFTCFLNVITEEEAKSFFAQDILTAENAVNSYVTVRINQNKFDALVSFVYNLGSGNFKTSTLLKKVNLNAPADEIRTEFNKWVNFQGIPLAGLVKRRAFEAELFAGKVSAVKNIGSIIMATSLLATGLLITTEDFAFKIR